MAEDSGERYSVALELAKMIGYAENKFDGSRAIETDDARSYWIELYDVCLCVTSMNGSVRSEAKDRARTFKKNV
jgi:hypothetical protein